MIHKPFIVRKVGNPDLGFFRNTKIIARLQSLEEVTMMLGTMAVYDPYDSYEWIFEREEQRVMISGIDTKGDFVAEYMLLDAKTAVTSKHSYRVLRKALTPYEHRICMGVVNDE